MMGAVKRLALVSNSCQPAAVLTVLDWRVKPPRSPRLTRNGIGRVFIGASVRKRKLICVTLSPVLDHELSSMIRTLLTVLPVIGCLGRYVAARLPNIVSSDPACELAVSISGGALHRATIGTGIADRVPAEHIGRTMIVAEDTSVLILGLQLGRGTCHLDRTMWPPLRTWFVHFSVQSGIKVRYDMREVHVCIYNKRKPNVGIYILPAPLGTGPC